MAVLDSSFHPANVAEPGAGLLSESESLKKWIADGVILKVDVLSQFLKTLKCADLLCTLSAGSPAASKSSMDWVVGLEILNKQ